MKINQDRQSAFLLTHLFIKISGMRGPGALAREVGCKGRQICHLDLTLLGYGGLGPNACTGDKSRPGNVITALTYNSEDPLGDLHSLVHVTIPHSQCPFHNLMENGNLIVLIAPPVASFGECPPLVPVF